MTEISFKGKEFVYNHHLAVPFRPLLPDASKGIGRPSLDGNLIVHGDNLEALRALLPLYEGKVDCVFIDPPYNTGNEGWCYSDNVNAPMIREWFNANPVGVEDGLRHDKWCAMMWPRLRMLHELLSEDGSLWITLDDNEIHRARCMLDEIFGEGNFVCKIVVQSNKSGQDYKKIAKTHEYVLVYVRSEFTTLKEIETNGENLPREDRFGSYKARELRNRNPKFGRHNRPNLFYPFYVQEDLVDEQGNHIVSTSKNDKSIEVYPMNSMSGESCWRWGAKRANQHLGDKGTKHLFATKTKNGDWRIFEKYRKQSVKAKTIWHDSKLINEKGTVELGNLGLTELFQFPKPLGLLEDILAIATYENAIILDSFAGSGTTAQAVLELNKQDGGNRRFILVEMEDYADKLTAERVRRVIKGYAFKGTQKTELLREKLSWTKLRKAEKLSDSVEKIENLHGHEYDAIRKVVKNGELIVTGEKKVQDRTEGLGGRFTYCTLGDPVELDKMLTGESLPPYEGIGSVLFHMATMQAFDPSAMREEDFYLGAAEGQHVWLIYRPDLDWLKSPAAALTLKRARAIAATALNTRHLVFASARYVSQKLLAEENLPVEFVPLPFALYRIDRS